ncbi:MAG TPA: Holliday junction resolvase RuvX [Terriglobia bacterium]|nr:Holliday junction resolvase RuvX [Terriglobia bacterium]
MHERILAIDFGLRRFGLAVSDALGLTAQGLPTLERSRIQSDMDRIRHLIAEHSVVRIIVGNPLSKSGNETSMSTQVAAFAEKLRKHLSIEVLLWDERLTSSEANRILRDFGLGIAKRRKAVDRMAATLLLQGYLDRQSFERERNAGRAIG